MRRQAHKPELAKPPAFAEAARLLCFVSRFEKPPFEASDATKALALSIFMPDPSYTMIRLLKELAARVGNYWKSRKPDTTRYRDLDLGFGVHDEQPTRSFVTIPNNRR